MNIAFLLQNLNITINIQHLIKHSQCDIGSISVMKGEVLNFISVYLLALVLSFSHYLCARLLHSFILSSIHLISLSVGQSVNPLQNTSETQTYNNAISQVTLLSVSGFYFLGRPTKMKMRFDISYLNMFHILSILILVIT